MRVFKKATGKNNIPPLGSVKYIPWVECTCGACLWPLFEIATCNHATHGWITIELWVKKLLG